MSLRENFHQGVWKSHTTIIIEFNKVAGTDRGIGVIGIISVQDEGAIVQILLIEVTARNERRAVELTVVGELCRSHRCRV